MPPSRQVKFELIGDAASVQRSFSETGRSAKQLGRDVDESNAALDRHDKAASKANLSAEKLGKSMRSLFEQTAKIGTIGLAAEGLSALGAAGGAAAAALAPLGGALAAYPALGSAAAQGLGVFKLATGNVFAAVGGLNQQLDTSSKKFKELTPQAQAFAKQLDALKAPIRDLSSVAQAGLFPGLEAGIKSLDKLLPVIKPIVKDTAQALGGLAQQAGSLIASWGPDLQTQGARNVKWMKELGGSALHLLDAVKNVTLAAGPLVDWMVKGASSIAGLLDTFSQKSRQSGQLADFFHQTQIEMSRVVRIGGDVATALFNIVKAGYPIGSSLLKTLTQAAEQFKDWTSSAKGQNSIAEFFQRAKPAIEEAGRLVVAVVKAFFQLGQGVQVAPLLATVRTQLLPAVQQLVDSTTKQFMPAFLQLAQQSILLFTKLGGTSGPLVGFTGLLGKGLGLVNKLLDAIPQLGPVVAGLIAVGGISKALGIPDALSGVRNLSGLLGRLTGAGTAGKAFSLFADRGATPAKPVFVAVVNGGAGTGGLVKDAEKGGGGLLSRFGLSGLGSSIGSGLAGIGEGAGIGAIGTGAIAALFAGAITAAAIHNAGNNLPSGPGGAGLRRQAAAEVPPPGFGSSPVLKRVVIPGIDQLNQLEKQLTAAEKAGDPAKLRQIADQIREIGKANQQLNPQAWGKLADQVDAFANAKGWQHAKTAVDGAKKNFQQLLASGTANLTEIRKTTDVNLMDIAGALGKDTAEGKDALARNFELAAEAVKTQMDAGVISTKNGLAAIRRYLSQELEQYGLSLSQARNIAKGNGQGGQYGDPNNNLGREGGASQAMGDVMPAVTASSGLGVIGQISQSAINLAKGGAQRLLEAASTSASASVAGVGTGGLQIEARQGLSYVQSHFGPVDLTSGYRTRAQNAEVGGAPNSDHMKGLAIDLVPADGWNKSSIARFDRIAAWARQSPWIRWIGWRGVPGHGPGNHLHLSFLDRVAGDMAMVGGKLRAYGGKNRATGDIGFQGLEDLWVQAGGSASMAPLMAHVAQAESGGNPNAHNPSGASGLWQILGQPFSGNVYDPLTNAKMAVWKYAHQGLGAWAASRGTWGKYVNDGETYNGRGGSSSASGGASSGSSRGSGAGSASHPALAPGLVSAAHGAAATVGLVAGMSSSPSDFQGKVDSLELQRAEAGTNPAGVLKAVMAEIKLKVKRLNTIKAALKRRLTTGTRSRLTQEATSLLTDLSSLWAVAQANGAKGAPPAGVVPGAGSDGAAGSSGGAAGADSGGGSDTSGPPTVYDQLDAEAAAARLTPGTDDDIAVAHKLVDQRQADFTKALATGDPRIWGPAATALADATDSLNQLTDAITNNSALLQTQNDLLKQQVDQTNAQLAVSQSQYKTLAAAVTDMVNGQIEGVAQRVGLGMAGLRSPAGTVMRT